MLFLVVNINEINTYAVRAISTRCWIELYWNCEIGFCQEDITNAQSLKDVIILTVSDFVTSRSRYTRISFDVDDQQNRLNTCRLAEATFKEFSFFHDSDYIVYFTLTFSSVDLSQTK